MTHQGQHFTPAHAGADVALAPGIHLAHDGLDLRITAAPVARSMWTTVSIDVSVNGNMVLRSGGQPRAVGDCSGTFDHDGKTHTLMLRWERVTSHGFPCTLYLDGKEIGHRMVPINTGNGSNVRVLVPYLVLLLLGLGFLSYVAMGDAPP